MTKDSSAARRTLVLGGATRLGAAVLRELARDASFEDTVIAADLPDRRYELGQIKKALGATGERVDLATYDPEKDQLGFTSAVLDAMKNGELHLLHLGHFRDRTLTASMIRQHNLRVIDQLVQLASSARRLESFVVVTDIGLVGDYPGRFSETWTDVGQVPFDEVDRSSLDVELICLEAKDLPVVRARVGLLSDLDWAALDEAPWQAAAEVLVTSLRILSKLPSFTRIPSAVVKGSLAPLTPTDWAAKALVNLARNPAAHGKALHLIVDPPPGMDAVLEMVTRNAGGARLTGGLPVGLVGQFGRVPGLSEAARKQADHLASWLTPHRYCLSRNDLDTSQVRSLLSSSRLAPDWKIIREKFFVQ